MRFLAAENGNTTRQFDPLFHDDDASPPGDLGTPLADEAALDWRESPQGSGLTLMTKLARTAPVQPSWLTLPDVRFWGH